MKDKISACSGFLVFLSTNYISSPHAVKELEFAYEEKKPIIAILIEEITIPSKLERIFSDESVVSVKLNESEKIDRVLEKILNN